MPSLRPLFDLAWLSLRFVGAGLLAPSVPKRTGITNKQKLSWVGQGAGKHLGDVVNTLAGRCLEFLQNLSLGQLIFKGFKRNTEQHADTCGEKRLAPTPRRFEPRPKAQPLLQRLFESRPSLRRLQRLRSDPALNWTPGLPQIQVQEQLVT